MSNEIQVHRTPAINGARIHRVKEDAGLLFASGRQMILCKLISSRFQHVKHLSISFDHLKYPETVKDIYAVLKNDGMFACPCTNSPRAF